MNTVYKLYAFTGLSAKYLMTPYTDWIYLKLRRKYGFLSSFVIDTCIKLHLVNVGKTTVVYYVGTNKRSGWSHVSCVRP